MLDEELLEVEEGAAVRDVLAELDDGDPQLGVGLGAGAGVAEALVDDELEGVGLLEDDAVEDLAAEAELEAEACRSSGSHLAVIVDSPGVGAMSGPHIEGGDRAAWLTRDAVGNEKVAHHTTE